MTDVFNKKSILEMAMGSIAEITDYEVDRVIANIIDPNTKPDAKRKIVLTLTFTPDDNRGRVNLDVAAKTTLVPVNPVRTALCITKGKNGELLLAEMLPQVPGQVDMEGNESPIPAMMRVTHTNY